MKKFIFSILMIGTLAAAPQAVVFDWGSVMAKSDREVIVDFMCKSLNCSPKEFKEANMAKRIAVKEGQSDLDFWLTYAKEHGIVLEHEWPTAYCAVLKKSIGANEEMFAVVSELKRKNIPVGLLSNIDDNHMKIIRDFGFYDPFSPCLLSCEIGSRKPDPKAYHLLLKKLQISAQEVVFIDDKAGNVEAAQKLGIDAILFHSPEQLRHELVQRELL